MERATGTEVYGCGSSQTSDITLNIQTTTGGNFSISLNGKNTVEHLKKLVSKKLKVAKDRICLLHRERQLRDGTLEDNGVLDGARVILLPSVETGLLSQRPENSVMQALESLNDSQVNDFLSGKSPLNLTMRLGDHMMLIQLQLSTLSASSHRSLKTSGPRTSSTSCGQASLLSSKTRAKPVDDTPGPQPSCKHTAQPTPQKKTQDEGTSTDNVESTHALQRKQYELLQNAIDLYHTMAQEKKGLTAGSGDKAKSADTTNCSISDVSDTSENDQSPIKSLSNLVSSPIDDDSTECPSITAARNAELVNTVKHNLLEFITLQNMHDDVLPALGLVDKPGPLTISSITADSTSDDSGDNFTDQSSFLTESTIDEYPMEHLFNSAVDKGLFAEQDDAMMDREISNLATTSHGSQESNAGTLPSFQSISEPLKNKRFQYLLHKTSKFKHPIGQNKQKAFMQSVVNKHKKRMQNIQDTAQPSTSRTEPYITNSRKLILQPSTSQDDAVASTSKQSHPFKEPDVPKKTPRASPTPVIDTRALIEASKNLTQKLKKLSKEVLTNKIDLTTKAAEETLRSKVGGSGAVIESMKHHGKGIYSGTFSGTLNPALQDRYGRPKRDISTIIHILNDLLCAAPPISLPTAQMEEEKLKLHITMGDFKLAKRKNTNTNTKESKNACTSTSDDPTKCLCCNQTICLYGKCDGHLPSTSIDSGPIQCDHMDCPCSQQREDNACHLCALSGETCKKCDTAKTLAIENSKTKCKLEQLRLVMQQKKQRREARKLKTLPYTNPPKAISGKPAAIKEEIESLA